MVTLEAMLSRVSETTLANDRIWAVACFAAMVFSGSGAASAGLGSIAF